ncbi:MAG: hypothetical protein Hals2KO_27170 [Halioglobus sp.]
MSRAALLLSAILLYAHAAWASTEPGDPVAGIEHTDLELVRAAIQRLDDVQQDAKWLFTMTIVEDGETRVIAHDARKQPEAQRELISVDGAPPSQERLRDFRKEEKKRVDEQDPDASFFDLIDMATVAELERSGDSVSYAFTPRLKDLEKAEGKVSGSLVVDTRSGLVSAMDIFSTEEFSPAFSVSLQSYRLSFHFYNEQGTPLLTNMTSRAVGKVGFLKKFDTRTDITFSDYRPAQD